MDEVKGEPLGSATTDEKPISTWEKTKIASGLIAAIAGLLVPIAVGITGHMYSSAIKERELQGRFVELAVGILREPADPNGSQEIRRWATTVIDRYSGVRMNEEVREELIKEGLRSPLSLPMGALPRGALPNYALP